MMLQKVILGALIVLMIFVLGACVIDKTPLEIEEEQCWNHKTTIRDYDYIKNRYFFVDTFYVNYFEQGWSDDLSNWFFNQSRLIRDLEVFISATYFDPNAVRGLASLNPDDFSYLTPRDYDTVLPISGQVEKNSFIQLQENVDYKYDYARGFFWVNPAIADNEVLAVSYWTDLDTVGTFSSEFSDSSKVPVFRLIKSMRMNPTHAEVWPLMMKNVYFLGDSMINHECFNIQIEYILNGEHQTIQSVDPKKSYMNLMGLDRKDENGADIDGGDGMVDRNSLMINRFDGTLILPGLHPFNPYPTSRFQIADTALLYNTTNPTNLQSNHKYDIIITTKVDE